MRRDSGRFGLRTKVIAAMLLVGLVPLFVFSVAAFFQIGDAFRQSAYSSISSLKTIKSQQVEDYLEGVGHQLVTLAESTMTIDALRALSGSFEQLATSTNASERDIEVYRNNLKNYYNNEFGSALSGTDRQKY